MRRPLPTPSLVLLGLPLLLTGCGADKPVTEAPPQSYAPPPTRPAVTSPVGAGAVSADDPLTASASGGTSDPLIGGSGKAARDPLIGEYSRKGPKLSPPHSQPLSGQDPDVDDSTLLMNGQTMPTRRTHWLRGRTHDAQVLILLNGIRLGEYTNWVDQDITPRLRVGVNTVTFTYQPLSAQSSAKVDLLEGEHHPPIPPLATFDTTAAASLSPSETPKPQTQTFTFTAE